MAAYETIKLIGEGIAQSYPIAPDIVSHDIREIFSRDPDGEKILRTIVRDSLPGWQAVQDALWSIAFTSR